MKIEIEWSVQDVIKFLKYLAEGDTPEFLQNLEDKMPEKTTADKVVPIETTWRVPIHGLAPDKKSNEFLDDFDDGFKDALQESIPEGGGILPTKRSLRKNREGDDEKW